MNEESPLDTYIEQATKQVRAFIDRQRDLCPTCTRQTSSGEDGGCHLCFHYDHCVECGRELESTESRNLGLGTHCRAKHRMRFTILPNMWDQLKSDEPEELIATLNEQAEELGLDFIVLLTWGHNPRFYFQQPHAPFDWRDMVADCLNGEEEVATLIRAMLLEEHEFTPHSLYEWEESEELRLETDDLNTEKAIWDLLMLATPLEGMSMSRRQATPPVWDSLAQIWDWHMDAPSPDKRTLDDLVDLSYDGDPDDTLYLGDLSPFDMLRGPGTISDPYHPYNDFTDYGQFSSKSEFQLALLNIWPWHSESWSWQQSIMEVDPWEETPRFSEHEHEDALWREIAEGLDFWGNESGRDGWLDTSTIIKNLKETCERKEANWEVDRPTFTFLCQFDQLAWLGYSGEPLFMAQFPIIDAAGNILYREDAWDYILENASWEFFEAISAYEVLEDTYEDILRDNQERLMRQHILSVSNVHTATPITQG